jgi:HD-like signal output (HDOD) protein
MGTLLVQQRLRSQVSSSNALTAAPAVYDRLLHVLADPRCSLVRVADVIESDVAMSARLLQLVSSAFFGPATKMTSLGACVAYLGLDLVRSLVLSAEIARSYPFLLTGFTAESVHERAMATSRLARRLAQGPIDPGQAFVAGLLHGAGQLVLASRAPADYGRALGLHRSEGLALSDAEQQVFGATHAEVGAYLLALWGQPIDVVRAIAYQDAPEQSDRGSPGLATILYASKRLSADPRAPLGAGNEAPLTLDESVLARVGALSELSRWRGLAERMTA